MNPRGNGLYALVLLVCVLAVYSNSFSGAFQYDDFRWLKVAAVTGGPAQIVHLFDGTSETCSLRGLAMATFNIQYWLAGEETYQYHIANLCIHLLCTLLVFAISRRLMLLALGKDTPLLALTVALLFALCPVQAYSVSYIAQRMECMATLSILATLWLWMRGNRQLAAIPFILGCFVKETVFITPFIIVAYSLFFEGMSRKHMIWLGTALVGMFVVAVQLNQPIRDAFLGYKNSLSPFLLAEYFTQTHFSQGQFLPVWLMWSWFEMLDLLVEYFTILVWPVPERLTIDTDYAPLRHPVFVIIYGHALIIAVALGVYYFCKSERKLLGFCFVLFLLSFAIYSAMLPNFADKFVIHRAYFAAFPVFLALVVLAYSMMEEVVALPAIAMILIFAGASHEVNNVFATELGLWKEAAVKSPNKVRPRYNYGRMLQVEGDKEAAETQYYQVLRLMREKVEKELLTTNMDIECTVKTYNNLGVVYMQTGRFEQALDCWKMFPEIPETRTNLKKMHTWLLWQEIQLEKREDVSPKPRPLYLKDGKCSECERQGWESRVIHDRSFESEPGVSGIDTLERHCTNQHYWLEGVGADRRPHS